MATKEIAYIKLIILDAFGSEDSYYTTKDISEKTELNISTVSKALHRYRTMGLLKQIDIKEVFPRKYRYMLTKRGMERLDFLKQQKDSIPA